MNIAPAAAIAIDNRSLTGGDMTCFLVDVMFDHHAQEIADGRYRDVRNVVIDYAAAAWERQYQSLLRDGTFHTSKANMLNWAHWNHPARQWCENSNHAVVPERQADHFGACDNCRRNAPCCPQCDTPKTWVTQEVLRPFNGWECLTCGIPASGVAHTQALLVHVRSFLEPEFGADTDRVLCKIIELSKRSHWDVYFVVINREWVEGRDFRPSTQDLARCREMTKWPTNGLIQSSDK